MPEPPLLVAPLWAEAVALRSARAGVPVLHAGMRARRSTTVHRAAAAHPAAPVVIVGLAGGLDEYLRPGDVVVSDEVRSAGTATGCPGGVAMASKLRRAGLPVHVGPIFESGGVVDGTARAELAGSGAVAVDMESARLLRLLRGHRTDVVRVIVDTPHRPLRHPATLSGGWLALRTLRTIARALGSGMPAPVTGMHGDEGNHESSTVPRRWVPVDVFPVVNGRGFRADHATFGTGTPARFSGARYRPSAQDCGVCTP